MVICTLYACYVDYILPPVVMFPLWDDYVGYILPYLIVLIVRVSEQVHGMFIQGILEAIWNTLDWIVIMMMKACSTSMQHMLHLLYQFTLIQLYSFTSNI